MYPSDVQFLIVDDNSPDGTADLVRQFAKTCPQVKLLMGQKSGLGDAYIRGISYAISQIGAEVVVQMDADFQHDPSAARTLLNRLAASDKDGVDVAIGSRYVAGGAIDQNWSRRRLALSKWGNRLARIIAGVSPVQDCTSGFKAIKTSALNAAKIDEMKIRGYAFQVVLLHRLLNSGAKVVEVPVYFSDRAQGDTKLGYKDLLEFFYNLCCLRIASHQTFYKFMATGASGVLVNLGSFQILLVYGVNKFIASPIAIELSIISNFILNNFWTFGKRSLRGKKRHRVLKYNLVSLATLAMSYGTFTALTLAYPTAHLVLLQGLAVFPAVLVNYFVNSRWTFRDNKTTQKRQK